MSGLTEKPCSRCAETKPLEAFSRSKKSRTGLRSECKDCQRLEKAEYRARNREEHNRYNRDWARANRDRARVISQRHRAKYPEATAAQKRAWSLANADRVREHKRTEYERHREKILARVEAWRKEKPLMRRAQCVKRRGLERDAAGTDYLTAEKIRARVEFYGGRCVYCGVAYKALDHRIPLSRGGANFPANLVPACTSCNSSKNARTEREFRAVLASRGGDATIHD